MIKIWTLIVVCVLVGLSIFTLVQTYLLKQELEGLIGQIYENKEEIINLRTELKKDIDLVKDSHFERYTDLSMDMIRMRVDISRKINNNFIILYKWLEQKGIK